MLNNKQPSGLTQRGRLAFLLKDSIIYGGAAALSRGVALITFPLLAHRFTLAEYGVLDYFLALAGLLSVIFIFGQDSGLARYYSEHNNVFDRRQLVSQSLAFQMGLLLLIFPLLWYGARWVIPLLIDLPDSVLLFKIVLLMLPFLLLINFSQNLLKWTFSRAPFLILSLGFSLVHASLLCATVLSFDVNIITVLKVSLLSNIIFGLLGVYLVRGMLAPIWNFTFLRQMLPFAAANGLLSIAGSLLPTLERTLVSSLLGADQLGEYAVAVKIAMLIGSGVAAFQMAWGPFSLALHKQPDAWRTYNWVLKLFTLAACLSSLLIAALADPLVRILASERYSGGVIAVFPLVMGQAIQAISWISEIGITIAKRGHLGLYGYLAGIGATLTGIAFLAPSFGLLGVAIGVMVGHIVKAVTASLLSRKAYPLPWQYWRALVIILITMSAGAASIWARKVYGVAAQNTALLSGVIIVLLAAWTWLLRSDERYRVIAAIRTMF